jgi:hypothetical protein
VFATNQAATTPTSEIPTIISANAIRRISRVTGTVAVSDPWCARRPPQRIPECRDVDLLLAWLNVQHRD